MKIPIAKSRFNSPQLFRVFVGNQQNLGIIQALTGIAQELCGDFAELDGDFVNYSEKMSEERKAANGERRQENQGHYILFREK